jgi:hypothetical protein
MTGEVPPYDAGTGFLGNLPEVLTVEEAAAVLRIGRRMAYEQAQLWRATGGREGLPVVVIGRCLRVPRIELERLLCPSLRDGFRSARSSRGLRSIDSASSFRWKRNPRSSLAKRAES